MFVSKINRVALSLRLVALQTSILGLKVWTRETAYHVLSRHLRQIGAVAYFDKDSDEFKAAVAEAVEEATSGLKAAKDKLLKEVKALKAKGGEVDPAEVERLEGEVEKLRGELADANKSVKALTTRAEKAEQGLTAEQAHTHNLLIENGLTAALAEAGVKDPNFLKAAKAMILQGHKPAVVVDGENRVAKVGDKALGDFVKEWAQGAEGKTFVAAPNNSGGGAGGGSGGGGQNAGNVGGTPAERQAAFAAKFPELANQ